MKKFGLSVGEDKEGSNLYATSSFLRASGYLSKLNICLFIQGKKTAFRED